MSDRHEQENGADFVSLAKEALIDALAGEKGDSIPPRYAIDLKEFTTAVKDSIKQRRIDSYQALLLLAANYNKPDEFGIAHPLQIIPLHNSRALTLHEKMKELRGSLKTWGVLDDIRNIFGLTMDNIINPVGNKPAHKDGKKQPEIIKRVFRNATQGIPTFSAIPKDTLLPLLRDAMKSDRMTYKQAAMMLSVNCHSLEMRRSGDRYLDHPMAVAAGRGLTEDQKCIALLHDVIENSNYTLKDFKKAGFPEFMVEALDRLTIRIEKTTDGSKQKEDYMKFIERCAGDANANAVKQADIRHNIRDAKPHKKVIYALALGYLDAVSEGGIDNKISLENWAGANMPELYKTYQEGKKSAAETEKPSKNSSFYIHLNRIFGS
jgi:hypothetical protein